MPLDLLNPRIARAACPREKIAGDGIDRGGPDDIPDPPQIPTSMASPADGRNRARRRI